MIRRFHIRFGGYAVACLLAIVSIDGSSRFAADRDTSPAVHQAPGTVLAWPEPPAPARIEFVRVLTPSTTGGRPSRLSRFFKAITGGDSTTPVLAQPYGIAVDTEGRVLVADTYAETIHSFDPARNRYSAIRVNTEALIGVAVLGARLIVTDSVGRRVICLTPKGKQLWSLGRDAGFERPTGVVAADDRVYVVDTLASRIVSVSAEGKVIGSFGTRGGAPGQLNFPTNIARMADGRLVVTDSMNFRMQTFTPDGRFLRTFGQLGDGAGDFNKPKGVAVDSDGHVYVVEGLHDTVQIFGDDGRFLLAFGESGAGDGQFWLPAGIAIHDDFIYVADAANRRVQVFKYLKESR